MCVVASEKAESRECPESLWLGKDTVSRAKSEILGPTPSERAMFGLCDAS